MWDRWLSMFARAKVPEIVMCRIQLCLGVRLTNMT